MRREGRGEEEEEEEEEEGKEERGSPCYVSPGVRVLRTTSTTQTTSLLLLLPVCQPNVYVFSHLNVTVSLASFAVLPLLFLGWNFLLRQLHFPHMID